MPPVDALPSDQRAVLALVLQRGRSYEEIADMLAIDRGVVRQRALDALDALVPEAAAGATDRHLVGDYLLGQLPSRVASEVRQYIAASEGDSRWATAVAAELAPLVRGALPDIPVGAPLGAAVSPGREPPPDPAGTTQRQPAVGPEQPLPTEPPPTAPAAGPEQPRIPTAPPPRAGAQPSADVSAPDTDRQHRWIWPVLGTVAVVAVVVIIALVAGGSKPRSRVAPRPVTHPSRQAQPPRRSTGPRTLAALVMAPASSHSSATGVADVVRRGRVLAVVINARGLPANGAHNAYAVWLSSGPGRSWLVGFVPAAVGKSGALQTEGRLPTDAGQYGRLLLTLETQPRPTQPGSVVLSAPFRQ